MQNTKGRGLETATITDTLKITQMTQVIPNKKIVQDKHFTSILFTDKVK